MTHSSMKHLDSAQGFAAMPGCFGMPQLSVREVSLLGPLPVPRRSVLRGGALWAAAAVLLFMPVVGAFGAVATLNVQDAAAPPDGRSLAVPVVLSAPKGCAVAALQFDVEFDPVVMSLAPTDSVSEGTAAKAAGKQLSFSKVAPNKIRVLVVGLNAQAIAGGEIAKINFSVSGGIMAAATSIHVGNAVLADPNGAEVPVQAGGDASAIPVAQFDTPAEDTQPFPPTAVALVFACLLTAGAAAGFAWKLHRRRPKPLKNTPRRPAARCAAGKHG